MSEVKTAKFEAEVSQVLSLVINSLYSNKDIFIRELISNASDALDKLKFEALTNQDLLKADPNLRIEISEDKEAKTITFWDNGIGMTEDELAKHLGTVAHSGSKAFMEALKASSGSADNLNIIGQFGVGFYSAFLVADRVEVVSRKAGTEKAYKWTSEGVDTYTIEPAERDVQGTSITLHLKEDEQEYLQPFKLRSIVKEYSDFVGFPIMMLEVKYNDEPAELEQVNQAEALWLRRNDDLTPEQYEEFYKHLSDDWEPPLAYTHFKIEGTQEFTGLLYIPKRQPFDLFNPDASHGLRLFVKRVFIMDDADALMPKWLRFMRGVVDSSDLPLNVSRELLQDSRLVRAMKKQLTKKSLELLKEIADERPDDYKVVWKNYGVVIKEGLYYEPDRADKLAEIVRFDSNREEMVSLKDYVARMPEDQDAIYYAVGQSRQLLDASPLLERLKKKNYEILYLTDSVDQWAISNLTEFEGKSLVDATSTELEIEEDEEEKAEVEKKKSEMGPLLGRFKSILVDSISEVRLSHRLADSPACLVVPEGGMAAHIERLLRMQNVDMPAQKRILELNPTHPLIVALSKLEREKSPKVDEWVELVYDQALLAEGSPIENPGNFAKRFASLMTVVANQQVLGDQASTN